MPNDGSFGFDAPDADEQEHPFMAGEPEDKVKVICILPVDDTTTPLARCERGHVTEWLSGDGTLRISILRRLTPNGFVAMCIVCGRPSSLDADGKPLEATHGEATDTNPGTNS
jgi:hypothetical protein